MAEKINVEPGQVVEIEDEDYRYGVGKIVLRVIEVGQRMRHGDQQWVTLKGRKLNGTTWGKAQTITARIGGIVVRPPKAAGE